MSSIFKKLLIYETKIVTGSYPELSRTKFWLKNNFQITSLTSNNFRLSYITPVALVVGYELVESVHNVEASSIKMGQELVAPHAKTKSERRQVVHLAGEAVPEAACSSRQVVDKGQPGHVRTSHRRRRQWADQALLHQRHQPTVQSRTDRSLVRERGPPRAGSVDPTRGQKVGQEVGWQEKDTSEARKDAQGKHQDHGSLASCEAGRSLHSKTPN